MCEFCIKHGEGKKWYEVMENYSQELLAQKGREAYMRGFIPNMQRTAQSNLDRLQWAKNKMPMAYRFIRKIGTHHMKKIHFGQVVPLEEAEKIVDMVQSVTRIPCVCRSVTIGKKDARYCMLLGIDPTGLLEDYPDIRRHLETLTIPQAKDLLREFDRKGLVHSIWTFKTPYIGAICNCDHDCMAYKIQITSDLMNIMFRSEYLADVDPNLCIGCRNCMKTCQFGAIEYSSVNAKCYISPIRCYGCGLCRNECKKDAIRLIDKVM